LLALFRLAHHSPSSPPRTNKACQAVNVLNGVAATLAHPSPSRVLANLAREYFLAVPALLANMTKHQMARLEGG
jgi:hypothetical protein